MPRGNRTTGRKAQSLTAAAPAALETGPDLEHRLLAELAPQTAYEQLIARNMVANEIEAIQLRHHRERLLRHAAGDTMALSLARRKDPTRADGRPLSDPEIRELIRAWINGSAPAAQALAELDVDEDRHLTDAFLQLSPVLAMITEQLAQLERRRRRLREDYAALQTLRKGGKSIDDAEVIGA